MTFDDYCRKTGHYAGSGDRAMWDAAQSAAREDAAFTPAMLEAIYAAWHGAGVDIAGGNWTRFVGMLPKVAAERGHVRIPASAAEAKAMATVAIAWLREHAPDELRPEFKA